MIFSEEDNEFLGTAMRKMFNWLRVFVDPYTVDNEYVYAWNIPYSDITIEARLSAGPYVYFIVSDKDACIQFMIFKLTGAVITDNTDYNEILQLLRKAYFSWEFGRTKRIEELELLQLIY